MIRYALSCLRSPLDATVSTSGRMASMEGLRGVGALLVFLVHYAAFTRPWVGHEGLTSDVWMVLFNGGRLGVDVFFVLSGYLIYSLLMARPLPILDFARRRVRRIYPTFLAVFALYLALSYLAPAHSKLPPDPVDASVYLLQNLLLLPGLFDIRPMITVAWSLSYEVAYYLVAPVIVWALNMRAMAPWKRVLIWSAIGGLLILEREHSIAALFTAGILLYELITFQKARGAAPRSPLLDVLAVAVFGAALSVILALDSSAETDVARPVVLGAVLAAGGGSFALSYAALGSQGWIARLLATAPMRWMGNISYSFYLIHSVALRIVFTAVAVVVPGGTEAPWVFWAMFVPALAASSVVALLLFMLVERPLSLTPTRRSRPVMSPVPTAVPAPSSAEAS